MYHFKPGDFRVEWLSICLSSRLSCLTRLRLLILTTLIA